MRIPITDPDFYVYALLDPSESGSFQYRDSRMFDHAPIYIGKGYGNRCFEHLGQLKSAKKISKHLYNKMRKIFQETGKEPIIVKLQENLFEEQAFESEIFFIKQIGRADQKRGPLCNHTDGGEGMSGWSPSDETRRKMSNSLKGKNHYLFGKHLSEETRRKMSESGAGEKNGFYGKLHSKEIKKKMVEDKLGEKNPMFGRKHSEEAKQKIRDAKRRKKWIAI